MHDSFDGDLDPSGYGYDVPNATWDLTESIDLVGAVMSRHCGRSFDIEQYLAELVETLVGATAAVGALLWRPGDNEGFALDGGVNILVTDADRADDLVLMQLDGIETTFRERRPLVIAPCDPSPMSKSDPRFRDMFSLLAVLSERSRLLIPLVSQGQCSAVCELFRPAAVSRGEALWQQAALSAITQKIQYDLARVNHVLLLQRCELASELQTTAEGITSGIATQDHLSRCARAIYQLLGHGCVSIMQVRNGRAMVRGSSHRQMLDRRHPRTGVIERIASLVVASGQTLVYPEHSRRISARVRSAIEAYDDVSPTCSLAVIPLHSTDDQTCPGVLVVEGVDSTIRQSMLDKKLNPILPMIGGVVSASISLRSPWYRRLIQAVGGR